MSEPADAAAATLERAVALGRFSGLESLDAALRTTLAARTELRRHRAGAPLGGDPSRREIHLVVEGRLRERTRHGTSRDVGAGGIVGDLSALASPAEAAPATALADSVTLAIGLEDVIDLCEEHFALLVAVMRSVARAALAAEAERPPPRARRQAAAPARERGPEALDLAGRIALLAANPTLANVAVHTLGQLAQEARVVELARGGVLWEEGDASDRIVAVARGELVDRSRAGPRTLRAGDLAGLLEALAGVPRPGRADAATPVVALSLDASLLVDAMEDDVETAVDVLAALGGRLAGARR
jgi:CRP-like cAMP-binding protein